MTFPKITALSESLLVELGRVVAHFALLENTIIASIQGLVKCSDTVTLTLCAERSFRNLLDLASSLAKQSMNESQLETFEGMILKAQHLEDERNAYMHSIYGSLSPEKAIRSKTTAKRKHGLRTTIEQITPETINSSAMKIAELAGEMESFLQAQDFGHGWI